MSLLRDLRAKYPRRFYRWDLNTFVVRDAQLIYMDTPKTAGTAIKTGLMRLVGQDVADLSGSRSSETSPDMIVHDRALNPVPSITAIDETEADLALSSPEWLRLCVVRHPATRSFSAWFSKVLLREPYYANRLGPEQPPLPDRVESVAEIFALFADFLTFLRAHPDVVTRDPHWAPQRWLLFGDEVDWTVRARYEHLAEDLGAVDEHLKAHDFPALTLPQVNVSGLQLRPEALGADSVGALEGIYAADYKTYGYQADLSDLAPPTAAVHEESFLLFVNAVIGRNRRIQELHELMEEESRTSDPTGAERAALRRSLEACRSRAEEFRRASTEASQEVRRLRGVLDDVYASRSWRVTKPLRAPRGWWQSRDG